MLSKLRNRKKNEKKKNDENSRDEKFNKVETRNERWERMNNFILEFMKEMQST